MSRLCCLSSVGLILLALTGAVGCNSQAPGPTKFTVVGAQTSQNDIAVSGGNLMARTGKPAVMFGTVTKPKSSKQLSYVILFKLPTNPNGGHSFAQNSGAHGLPKGGGEVHNVYTINGNRVEATAVYELNAGHTLVEKETLTVGGKVVDPSAGRLFLLDITAVPPTYQQENITLPAEVPNLLKEEDVENYAESLLKTLQEKQPEIKDWLK